VLERPFSENNNDSITYAQLLQYKRWANETEEMLKRKKGKQQKKEVYYI